MTTVKGLDATGFIRQLAQVCTTSAQRVGTQLGAMTPGQVGEMARAIPENLARAGQTAVKLGETGLRDLRTAFPDAEKTAGRALAGAAGTLKKLSAVDMGRALSATAERFSDSPEAVLFALNSPFVPSTFKPALIKRLEQFYDHDKISPETYVAALKQAATTQDDEVLANAGIKALTNIVASNNRHSNAAFHALADVARAHAGKNAELSRSAFMAMIKNILNGDMDNDAEAMAFLFAIMDFVRQTGDPHVAVAFFGLMTGDDTEIPPELKNIVLALAKAKAEEFAGNLVYAGFFAVVVKKLGGGE